MKKAVRLFLLAACLVAVPMAARAEWQPVEAVETYSITGATGAELYQSIGDRGPVIGMGMRTIAHTSFKLTWNRKYEAQGRNCVLVSARPKLVITYTLPKPAKRLPEPVARSWQTFIDGVRTHERIHGDFIVEMTREIEKATVGLTVADDPGCSKIRTEMTKRLGALSNAQRQKSRDFDRSEMSDGGNIHQLILALVNGP